MRRFLLLFLILVIAVVLFAWLQLRAATMQHLVLPEGSYTLLVVEGDTLTKTIYKLQAQGILSHARWLLLYAQFRKNTAIRQGEYSLTPDLTGEALLQQFNRGRVLEYRITFVEGSTLADAIQLLSSQEKMINDIDSMDANHYKALLGFTQEQGEGWVFPDTYSYVKGTKMSEILLRAYRRMQNILNEEWEKKAKDLPYKSPYHALIMASIIEKETGVAYERPKIAGVFVRRLKKGMRLQTDPSVIYGVGRNFKGDLKRSHLLEETPYNTYTIDGLPPTPIALPGRAAIHAALHPDESSALYFVARGDGTHSFSNNYEQHQRAVAQHQLRRAGDYRSAPPEKVPVFKKTESSPPASRSAQ